MPSLAITSVQELRRITELRIKLDDGRSLLVTVSVDEAGVSRLDVDVLHAPENHSRAPLEVRFDTGD